MDARARTKRDYEELYIALSYKRQEAVESYGYLCPEGKQYIKEEGEM